MTRNRVRITALTAVGVAFLVVSAAIFGNHYLGHGRVGAELSSALPPLLSPSPAVVPTKAPAVPTKSLAVPKKSLAVPKKSLAVSAVARTVAKDKPGVPVSLTVAGHQVKTAVSADRLNADGSLFVPPDPRAVSWASQDVGPGSAYGTTILVGHVNKAGVAGVFSDLVDYKVGEIITLVLADGRTMRYSVAAPPIEVKKDELWPRRQELFDQSHSYAAPGKPLSGRLLLLSCGGLFDNRTGHYESNIFVFALPV